MPFESLTPDLTISCIGWKQAGGAWALRVPSFHMCPKSACCPFVCRGLEASLHNLLSVFLDLLCGLFFDFPLLLGAGPYLLIDLIFLWPTSWFPSFPAILFCYSCCNDLILLGLFRPAIYSFPQWPSMATTFFLLMGSCVPFIFLLGILGPFAFFGLPWPFY